MIIKNGEILAIDHIAHDNTLSGNGTSAKPVGLSQSTKDLIDSKVKKTDFETYKSSAANQISNINTKITTDESNFESYKSSAHNEIARVDASIAAVNAAKVNNTTFEQYQTDVTNNFTAVNKRIDDVNAAKVDNTTFDNFKGSANGELTGIKQSITDLDNAKQAKGDYVSASNFNSYKSSAHNEIARVDEKIDTTSANLRDNYYKTTETYNRTEVDEKFANFGGFKFRDPDPTKDNEPKLAPGEVIDPKAIYLTQPAGATQYLQWIWNTEVTPNVWKCIGDTTMDLSDYAKTVDVVTSANNNVQAVKDWADDKFETKQDFESVIAGYYTKDEADDLLNTKVDKTTFEAYQQTVSDTFDSVDRDFENTSAWANNTFATKTDLNNVQSNLETEISNLSTDIESDLADVSGKIINELNDVESALDNKINNVDTKLDTVSGELVGKIKTVEETLSADIDNVDKKVKDLKTELETEYYDADTIEDILAASGDYYDKDEIDSLLDDYVKTEELEPINEKIASVSAEFNKYYTKTEVDDEFTTKDTFDTTITEINNDLGDIVETVSAIDQDKADKSDLNDYYKISETSGKAELSAEFAKYTKTEDLHIPTTVAELTDSSNYYTTAETSGKNELSAAFDAILKYDVTAAAGIEVTTATDDGVKTFGISMTAEPVVTDTTLSGYNGIAANRDATINNQWNIGLTHDMLNTINGKLDSSVAATTYQEIGDYLENTDIELDANNKITGISGKELVITAHQSLANYYTKSDVDTALANKVDTSELETVSGEIVNMIPSLNGYATESWVENKHYLVANDIAGKADKTDLQYVSAGVDYVSGQIPSLNGYATEQYVQGASAEVTAWVDSQGFLTEIPDDYALKSDIPTTVAELTDSADYAKKTDLEGFVTSDGITTQGTDYVMTTTGWKVLSLPGGGMTQVIHDATLTGQGNADDNKLGVAWSALSGYTITSALSAGSATVAANLGTSSFADITGAINAKADATAISDMLTKTVASQTYQTIAGMSNYLTTAQYETDSAKYVVTGDILTAASNKLTGIKVGNTDYTIQETNWTTTIQTASAKAYNDATANADELYVTKASAHNEFVNTSSWANNKFQEKGNYVATADLLINASNQLTGIKIDNSTNYPIPLFGGVTTDNSTITGDGNTNPLGVAWSALSGNTITSALSAGSASYAVALGTTASYSALSDIAGAINDAKFAGVSIAANSSITGNGLSTNKLGLVTSAENALTAVDNKLDKTAIVTATIDNTNYVTAVNINSTNIPIKDTSFWEVTAATGTTASNNTWQHYISTTNTFNYYKMVIHPYGTSSAQEWANDGIIHIILEA